MCRIARPVGGMALLSVTVVALVAVASATEAGAAATYLVKGTQALGNNTSDQEVIDRKFPWIVGMTGAAPAGEIVVVDYPASFWPVSAGGMSDPTFGQSVSAGVAALPPPASVKPGTVFAGGSQGAIVISMYKREFNRIWESSPQDAPDVTAVMIENPMRPNGGILKRLQPLGRIPIFDIPFHGAAPTHTAGAHPGEITTYDVSPQYNVFSDFPTNPLFVLSVINAVMGIMVPPVSTDNVKDAVLQGEHGDTRYYLIPTYPVPILMPLNRIPRVGPTIADMLDPAMRVLVEAGYDRTTSPGQPTSANLRYFPNPVTLARNLAAAVPTGLDNGIEDVTGSRPFGTERPDVMGQGAYGLNGPPVTRPPANSEPLTTTSSSEPEAVNTDKPLRTSRLPVLRSPEPDSSRTPPARPTTEKSDTVRPQGRGLTRPNLLSRDVTPRSLRSAVSTALKGDDDRRSSRFGSSDDDSDPGSESDEGSKRDAA